MLWSTLSKSKFSHFFITYYVFIFLWWLKIFFSGQTDGLENYWFNIIYGWIALIGGINGIYVALKKWGGFSSIIGKGLILLSIGLLGEWFGNAVWGYANVILRVEVPYPGLADIGFFSIIPLYGFAMILFAKAAGIKLSLKTFSGQIQALIIPLAMVALSWALFIKDIPFDTSNPIRLFLDYGYPGGEAITVSIAILTYSLSVGVLGGKMRTRVLFIILALIAQYVTDYSFLYTAGIGTYYNASFVDLMYATSYTIMSLALIAFKDYA
jgi:hypothetical protein